VTTAAVPLEEQRSVPASDAAAIPASHVAPRPAATRLILGTIVLVEAGWLSVLGLVAYKLLT
jgi:hypothetical protein